MSSSWGMLSGLHGGGHKYWPAVISSLGEKHYSSLYAPVSTFAHQLWEDIIVLLTSMCGVQFSQLVEYSPPIL